MLRFVQGITLALLVLLAACGGGDSSAPGQPAGPPAPPAPPVATSIVISAGNQQTAAAQTAVATPPAVIVRDAQNRPMAGVSVQFTVTEGGGTVEGPTQTTDAAGEARVSRWVLGPSGNQRLAAAVSTLAPAVFSATVEPSTVVTDSTLPVAGGRVEITTPGHPYRGFTVTVPSAVFPAPVNWRLRIVTPTTPPALPAGFQVAGPILEVRSEAPRASGLLTVVMPIATPADRGVLVALRDPERGLMEFLTPVARTANSITLVTTHLRGDLLVGRSPSPTARLLGGPPRTIGVGSSLAQLIPIAFPLPIPSVAPLLNPASDRWPVLDNGSGSIPTGFGVAIPALTALNQALGGPQISSFVKGLAEPGFYADAAPLATLELTHRRLTQTMSGLLTSINAQLRQQPKAERDQLVHQLIAGNLALLRSIIPVAYTRPNQGDAAFGVVYSSSESVAGSIGAFSDVLVALGYSPTQGFATTTVKQTADGANISTDGVIPLASTLLPFEQFSELLAPLQQIATLPPQARNERNRDLARQAGLPWPSFEMRVISLDPWLPLAVNQVIARSRATTVRLNGLGGSVMMHVQSSGLEAVRGLTSGLDLGASPAVTSLPRSIPTAFIMSPFVSLFGSLRQLTAQALEVGWGPFEVTPSQAPLDSTNSVTFTADVPLPPTDGFRIRWEWGDGETSDNLGLTTATHKYAVAADYTVIASLRTVGGTVLAADTVTVAGAPRPYWRITSIVDRDSLLEPNDNTPLQRLLARLLAVPQSGLIAIDDEGGGNTVLRLRVLPTLQWVANACCAPPTPLPGEMRQTLGVRPTVSYAVGPFFSGFGTSQWTQSTTNLGAGTLTGQFVDGGTKPRVIKQAGTQAGPVDFIRISATRNGTTMTGTITVYAWFEDDDDREVDPATEPTTYVLAFTAVRVR